MAGPGRPVDASGAANRRRYNYYYYLECDVAVVAAFSDCCFSFVVVHCSHCNISNPIAATVWMLTYAQTVSNIIADTIAAAAIVVDDDVDDAGCAYSSGSSNDSTSAGVGAAAESCFHHMGSEACGDDVREQKRKGACCGGAAVGRDAAKDRASFYCHA